MIFMTREPVVIREQRRQADPHREERERDHWRRQRQPPVLLREEQRDEGDAGGGRRELEVVREAVRQPVRVHHAQPHPHDHAERRPRQHEGDASDEERKQGDVTHGSLRRR
jgi:hypothetical protein